MSDNSSASRPCWILGHNPPEIAYWERGGWWRAGDPKPWHPEAVTVVRSAGVQAAIEAGRVKA